MIRGKLRQAVIARAGNRCEYCALSQISQEAEFHIDHVIPVAAGGTADLENLALACVSCSLRKAARQTAEDPLDRTQTPLFNPRCDRWSDHFQWHGERLLALTSTGRATIAALQMNRVLILAIRREEMIRGRHPPS